MAADHGPGLDDDEDIGPPEPHAAQGRLEQTVQLIQPRARPLPLEHGDLLPQCEELNCSVMPAAEKDSERTEERKGEIDHEHMAVACRNVASADPRLRTASR